MATSTRWTAGNTTPCLATRLGYGACVAELLQHGAHVMVFSRTGTHAFFAAMRGGHLVIARTLLHVNPNEALSTTDGRGFLFLHYAVTSNDIGFLAELNALRSVDNLIDKRATRVSRRRCTSPRATTATRPSRGSWT